jgi:hypothetical protein
MRTHQVLLELQSQEDKLQEMRQELDELNLDVHSDKKLKIEPDQISKSKAKIYQIRTMMKSATAVCTPPHPSPLMYIFRSLSL